MKDFLIVGQGLAGSLLAWELIQAGASVTVVDNGHRSAASWVAAGLINPITGMRMVKSPHTEKWLAAADSLYLQVQQTLAIRVRHQLPMWRIFTDPKQQQAWQERLQQVEYRPYIGGLKEAAEALPYCAALGFGEVAQTGYIDTKLLLTSLKQWLRERASYLQSECNYDEIKLDKQGVRLDETEAKRLIFCEGARAVDNPWFDALPLSPVKGEILTLETQPTLPAVIANFGKWVLPVGEGRVKLGSTYDWEQQDLVPTNKARAHLLEQLSRFTQAELDTRVVGHEVGLRPNSRDRLPLIGRHPNEERLWMFNGFGSRGSLMIPYYAAQLRAHLLNGTALDADCELARWR